MPRGGARPGAGRKPKPKGDAAPALKSRAVAVDGTKPAGAESWPFGAAPPAPPTLERLKVSSLEFLQSVYQDASQDVRVRIQAASIAAPYEYAKKGEGLAGKKAEKQDRAKEAGSGRFGAAAPPRLVAANGRPA